MSSYIPDLTRDNLSFYTVPAAFVLVFMPLFYKVSTYQAATKRLPDALQPRDFCGSVREDQSLDQKTKGRLLRADGAHNNGFENLGVFAAGVVAMNMARLSPATMNGLSIGYCNCGVLLGSGLYDGDVDHGWK